MKKVRGVRDDRFSYVAVRNNRKSGNDIVADIFEIKYSDIDRYGIVVFMRRIEKDGIYGLEVIAASSDFNEGNSKLISHDIDEISKEVLERRW